MPAIPDTPESLAKEMARILTQHSGERMVIECSILSIIGAMQRGTPEQREDLRQQLDAFVADPEDRGVMDRLAGLLRAAHNGDHRSHGMTEAWSMMAISSASDMHCISPPRRYLRLHSPTQSRSNPAAWRFRAGRPPWPSGLA